MNDIAERKYPLDGPILTNTHTSKSKHDAETPAPVVQYKKNQYEELYGTLSYIGDLYVLPIVNNHFLFWITVAADTSHDVKPSDHLRVEWTARDGSRKYISESREVRCIEQPLRFLLPSDEVKKFEGVPTDIVCVRERLDEHDVPSLPKGLLVSPHFEAAGNNSVEGVIDGFLDAEAYPNGLIVTTLVLSNLGPHTHLVMQWNHSEQPRHQQIIAAEHQGSAYTFFIAPEFYQGSSGASIYVQLALLSSSASFDFWYGLGAVRFNLK